MVLTRILNYLGGNPRQYFLFPASLFKSAYFYNLTKKLIPLI